MLRTTLKNPLLRSSFGQARRSIQSFEVLDSDVNVTRAGKTIIASGSGGRSSRTGYTATIFGANGMLGTQLTAKLAKHGTICVVPFREEMSKRHLKVAGDLGVVNFVEFDLRNIESIEESVRNSDIVFNLLGRNFETKNFSFEDVHVEGTRRIADAVKKYNVARYVHVSSHSADPNSSSKFLATKGIGEEIAREIVPDTTIVRPGPIYGPYDRFLNIIASQERIFAVNGLKEKLIPVNVRDVAAALEMIGYDDSTAGETFELYGPQAHTMAEIVNMVRKGTMKDLPVVDVPKAAYKAFTAATQYVYWTTTSPDEVERMFIDQTVTPGVKGFADLGIEPGAIEDEVLHIVRHHRSNLYLHNTIEQDEAMRKEREFIHIID